MPRESGRASTVAAKFSRRFQHTLSLKGAIHVGDALTARLTRASPLPPGDLVVLADVFVTDPVAEACAARCEEALRRGSDVLVVAAARSTRDAFLGALGRGSFGPAPARLDGGEEGLWLVDGGAG